MKWLSYTIASALVSVSFVAAQNANITLIPSSTSFDADNTAFYYSKSPLLLANDGSAADGGFRVLSAAKSPASQVSHQKTGRSKVVLPIYDVGGKDVYVTIAAPDSILRVFDAKDTKEIVEARKTMLGDWSTACAWRSEKSGENYFFLFGKKKIVQFLVRKSKGKIQILEVQTFSASIEGENCAVARGGIVYFSSEDQPLYSFVASESTTAPTIKTVTEDIEVVGLAVYRSSSVDYLFVAHDEVIDVYDSKMSKKGSIGLEGIPDLSIEGGLAIFQGSTKIFSSGAISLAYEGEDATGAAIAPLEAALKALGIKPDTTYNPRDAPCKHCKDIIPKKCSNNGFIGDYGSCSCFPGFTGRDCSRVTCKKDCSGHGKCAGPNICQCHPQWAGPDCSFLAVKAKYETDANGGDGDDPAVWIHPSDASKSKIVTTTKSDEGAGLSIFDLKGNLLQHQDAEEPNNVDVIYNFDAGGRKIDLAFAACRGDNTLCFFELNSTGLLVPIAGGVQPTPEDYEVYGSCTYTSKKTKKTYVYVNSKDATYLQYELSFASGSLKATLVRKFKGGSGGQVEGCVGDDGAGYIFIGEEPEGIWRYDAEPDGSDTGLQIAKVGDGKLAADVEGITLVPAKTGAGGYIFVSSQGESKYLVYQRAPPHEYVMTFTIVDNKKAGVDHVSNTDGIAAVGNRLNGDFPGGLFVTHDDANELVGGGTAEQASFKLASLQDILGEERTKKLGYAA